MTIQELFLLGMKRSIPALIWPAGLELNLGAGNNSIEGADNLDFPQWDAEKDAIPHCDETVGTIYAFHFLEHLHGARVIAMLREIERVLVVGGTANIVVPHASCSLAQSDLDHKSAFTEETFRTLFSSYYYTKHTAMPWRLHVHCCYIMGIAERNLAVFVQLEKQ